jgi:hypothetical protein
MSSTYLTLLQDAIHQAKEDETFQSFETRGSQYGAVDIAMEQTNKLLPKKKKKARTLHLHVLSQGPEQQLLRLWFGNHLLKAFR